MRTPSRADIPSTARSFQLSENGGLPQSTGQRRTVEVIEGRHAHQESAETGSKEMQLGRFDQGFGGIGKPGLQQSHDAGPFQKREPFTSGRWADPDIAGKFRFVEHLRGAQGTGPKETLKIPQAPDLQLGTEVAFQVGGGVGLMKIGGIESGSRLR